jgi:hypothetical protein
MTTRLQAPSEVSEVVRGRGSNLSSGTIMPTSTTSRGSSVFQLLNTTKKLLQDATIDTRYVWGGEIRRVGGLKLEFLGSRWVPK